MGIHMILASHGLYAQEALNTAGLIIGDIAKYVDVISVTAEKTYDLCLKELLDLYASYEDKRSGVLILTDIYGGTPAKAATYLALTEPDILVYSGFSMPVLMELFIAQPKTLEEAGTIIERAYEMGLVCINDKLKEKGEQDGDQMDSY
ncbi:PTS sugar transporter subunit IIA [Lacrimispora brassicae]